MVTLYTIDCPQCIILEKKLRAKNITFDRVDDRAILAEKGFSKFPILEVDGKLLEMFDANAWVNSQNS